MPRPFQARLTAAGAAALACLGGTTLAQPTPLDPQQQPLPQATTVKGQRPKSNPTVLPPAAIKLDPSLQRLAAPASLALPTKRDEVRVVNLRPLSLKEAENLAELNDPNLKAIASQVDQAQSNLRYKLALWYPTLDLQANNLPSYLGGQQIFNDTNPATVASGLLPTISNRWQVDSRLTAQWSVINPRRVPEVSAARDQFEKAKNQYLIGLRALRLQVAEAYYTLQLRDEQVRVYQQAVSSSLISLRNAKLRLQAGVATKLDVLTADSQLATDQYSLDEALNFQASARRDLARVLNLPQNVSPAAKDSYRAVGLWQPSLEESIIGAYAFREELDNLILDVSASNSQANSQLADVQPFVNLVNSMYSTRYTGVSSIQVDLPGTYGYAFENSVGLSFSWSLFDGGAARSLYRQYKQKAQENAYRFSEQRNIIRFEVERNYYELVNSNRDFLTQARNTLSARESLRLVRLRYSAGVATQFEVQQTQQTLTQAEFRWTRSVYLYNLSLARLRRYTGLDAVVECRGLEVSPIKPAAVDSETVPVPPSPLTPPCAMAPAAISPTSRLKAG